MAGTLPRCCLVQPRPDAASSPSSRTPQIQKSHTIKQSLVNPRPIVNPSARRQSPVIQPQNNREGTRGKSMMLSSSQAVVSQGGSTSGFGSHRDEKFVGSRRVPLMVSSGLRQVSWRWQGRGEGGRLRAEVSNITGNFASKGLGVLGVRCKVISVTEESFETEVLKSDLPVLVDFWANWCGPCKLVATSIDAIDRKYDGKLKVVKIDVDQTPKLVEAYKVYGLPTLIMFRDGEVISGGRYEGAISLAKLESMLKKFLPSLAAA